VKNNEVPVVSVRHGSLVERDMLTLTEHLILSSVIVEVRGIVPLIYV
jgi:hypothetical protein